MSSKMFTVIVSVYNVMPYLEECLGSLAFQTFRDFDVVLVNDGSTDGSRACCGRFAEEHPDIPTTIVDKENGGLLQARISGLKQAGGDFVVTLDGDDELRADALETIASCIREFTPDVVCFDHSRSGDYSSPEPALYEVPTLLSGEEIVPLLKELCVSSKLNSIWGKAFRREYADGIFLLEDLGRLQYGEDLLQSAAVLGRAEKVVYFPEAIYHYRWNPDSITNRVEPERLRGRYDDMKRVRVRLRRYASGFDRKYPGHGFGERSYIYDCVELYRLMQAAAICGREFFTSFASSVATDAFFAEACHSGLSGTRADMSLVLGMVSKGHYGGAYAAVSLVRGLSRSKGKQVTDK